MDGLFTIILRTIFLYSFMWLMYSLMGKSKMKQLNILDLIVSFMIADMAVLSIEEPNAPMLKTIIAIGVLIFTQILIAFLSMNRKKVRQFTDGQPTPIIKKGEIDEDEMRKQRYNDDDLRFQLRENHIEDLSDVEFAILEPTGKLSIVERSELGEQPMANKEYNIVNPLILDGQIQEKNLDIIHKSEFWLHRELHLLGVKDIKKITYCEYHHDGSFFIDMIDGSF